MPAYVRKLQDKFKTVGNLYEAIQTTLRRRVSSETASWSLWDALL